MNRREFMSGVVGTAATALVVVADPPPPAWPGCRVVSMGEPVYAMTGEGSTHCTITGQFEFDSPVSADTMIAFVQHHSPGMRPGWLCLWTQFSMVRRANVPHTVACTWFLEQSPPRVCDVP